MSNTPSVLARYPEYEVVIGMEVHVQLTTKSKIFCTCANEVIDQANRNICQICTGQPGVLPVFNQQVMEYAIKAGLATNCSITPVSEFSRKHYFYPDLPKNYQITQQDYPICAEGHVTITLENGQEKKIRILRIHIEEDAGKNTHAGYSNESFVDLNRAGTPLLELVSYPDINSAYETREYLKTLRLIVQYLGICSGNMEDGAFRADTNISVRKKGETKLGTKCELKNINSFKFIADAVEYEIERQIQLIQAGGKVKQETRLWDPKEHKTIAMRSKEEAADYRYFRDPDLPLIHATPELIETLRKQQPELPQEKFKRLQHEGLNAYEAEILVDSPELADYYSQAHMYTQSKSLINWVLRDIMGLVKEQKVALSQLKTTPKYLAQLVDLVDNQVINNRAAQEVFGVMAQTGQEPHAIVKQRGLEQLEDTGQLEDIIKTIIADNPQVVSDYKSGKERLWGFFVGQAMQKTKGKGNPSKINELLKKYLSYS